MQCSQTGLSTCQEFVAHPEFSNIKINTDSGRTGECWSHSPEQRKGGLQGREENFEQENVLTHLENKK